MICRVRSRIACCEARKEEMSSRICMRKRSNVGESFLSIKTTTSSIPHEELETKGMIMERRMTWNIQVSSKVMVCSDNLLQRRDR
jgi:hypothetical protein